MSIVTVVTATPLGISWRVGNSLTIESHRDFIVGSILFAEHHGYRDIDGHRLTPHDLYHLVAAMDEAALMADSRHVDRILDDIGDNQ